MKFENQIAFITGASTGIGRQIALALAREGAHIAALARSADKLATLQQEVEALGRRCTCFAGDVRDRSFVMDSALSARQTLGPVDILVNNAGLGVGGAVYEVPLEDIQYQFDVNFYGVVHATHAVLPGMMERRRGMIINISSIVGKAAIPYSGYYCATKFALTALSDAWRLELRPFNIHVLNVCPGATSGTAFHENLRRTQRRLPHRYEMTAEEVARRAVAAAAARKRELVLTTGGRLFVFATRMAPALVYYAMAKWVPYLISRKPDLAGRDEKGA
ncbi:MAG: SDR family oxidoreductase [Acidobacteria bacterium]|nr:SDR family oxidoreductase [Acidobacteriota bacterium]